MGWGAALYIIAGPNGSGKTTLAKEFIENAAMAAGRIFFAKLNEYLESEKSVAMETTLSGKYHNRVIKKFKQKGYEIKLLYVFLESSNLCIDRIRFRVFKGGHNVPDNDVIRRYARSMNNFLSVKNEVDHWILYYNGGEKYIEIAQGCYNSEIVSNEEFYNLFVGGNKNG